MSDEKVTEEKPSFEEVGSRAQFFFSHINMLPFPRTTAKLARISVYP